MSGFKQLKTEDPDEEAVDISTAVVPVAELVGAVDEKTPAKTRMVRVVAPCGLPPMYRLTVETNDVSDDDAMMMVDVIVPSPGVHEGQEFEAEIVQPPSPITGGFSNDLCDCCGDPYFCTSFWCSGLMLGAIVERLKLTWFANPGPHKSTYKTISGIFIAFNVVYFLNRILGNKLSIPLYAILIVYIAIATKARIAMRQKYRIEGDGFKDCCISYWCGCCSVIQMHRHMRKSGHPPRRPFKKLAEGSVVV